MISISNCPQFGSEDLCEIPIGSGRVRFEFDINLIDTCFPLFPCASNEVLARDLTRARVIAKDDIDLSTKNALVTDSSHDGLDWLSSNGLTLTFTRASGTIKID
jgi:hypothetical protein